MKIDSNATFIPPGLRLLYPAQGVVFSVRRGDPVVAVQEAYGLNRDGTGDHRYQILFMPNGNTVTAFWTDLGPAEDFKMQVDGETYQAPPYFQLVLMEHDVAECLHMAEQGRTDSFAVQLLHTQVNESDLFARYQQLIEEDFAIYANRSVFGPGGVTQRNGFSRLAAREQGLKNAS